jgi:hypothetical protein
MRVIALLSLIFGFMGMLLLDGQTFTHAVMGIIFGIAAIIGGLVSARKDYADEGRRCLGRIMAALGLVLALFCATQLPSAYQKQTRFNETSKKIHEMYTPPPSASAIVRVQVGNPSAANIATNADATLAIYNIEEAVFRSYDCAQHANNTLRLANLWGVPEVQANTKIQASLSVQKGSAPGLFVVQIHGFDHDLSVKILNELCSFNCSKLTSASVNGGVDQEVHTSIVQAAR